MTTSNVNKLSKAQQEFLESIPHAIGLVLKFNISRIWRINFSNLCLQAGFESFYNKDWLDSLDEFDRLVNKAQENARNHRRNRLIDALKKDSSQESMHGVSIHNFESYSSFTSNNNKLRLSMGQASFPTITQRNYQPVTPRSASEEGAAIIDSEANYAQASNTNSSDLSITSVNVNTSSIEDDNDLINFLDFGDNNDCWSLNEVSQSTPRDDLMRKIMTFIEEENIPFHSIDCWIPCDNEEAQSFSKAVSNRNGVMQIIHAGHACHSSLSSMTARRLHDFGAYSQHFSFAPNAGLPGRCYSSNLSCWDSDILNKNPEYFKRLNGAKLAGIQTAVGIPIDCSIVVGMYSLMKLARDEDIVAKCTRAFQRFYSESKHNTTARAFQPHQSRVESSDSFASHAQFTCDANEISSCSSESISADKAMEIANLLAEYMPSHEPESKRSESIRSLRLILLKCPHKVTADELQKVIVLRKSYESYCKAQRKKCDIVNFMISDWELLSKGQEQKSPWGPQAMTHVDYSAVSLSPLNIASQGSPTNENESSQILRSYSNVIIPPLDLNKSPIRIAPYDTHARFV